MRKYVRKLRARKLKKYVEFIGVSAWILLTAVLLEPLLIVAVKAAYILSVLTVLTVLWFACMEEQVATA